VGEVVKSLAQSPVPCKKKKNLFSWSLHSKRERQRTIDTIRGELFYYKETWYRKRKMQNTGTHESHGRWEGRWANYNVKQGSQMSLMKRYHLIKDVKRVREFVIGII
jgi:hypothetical protein